MADSEISEINLFLTISDTTLKDCFKRSFPVNSIKESFIINESKCSFIYFVTQNEKQQPIWLNFINDQLSEENKIEFQGWNKNPNVLITIEVKERIFIGIFGRSARSYLNFNFIEPEFGIRVAMNMCGNEEIKQTKTNNQSIISQQINRQNSQPSEALTYNIGDAEILKYISARMEKNKSITLCGKDSLTIKLSGKDKWDWETLVNNCRQFLDEYSKSDFKKTFPNYLNFEKPTQLQSEKLDEILIKTIKSGKVGKLHIAIPEFFDDDDYSYSYYENSSNRKKIYPYIEIEQLKDFYGKDFEKVNIKSLKSKRIYAYSNTQHKVLDYENWTIYKCINFDASLDGEYFILNDGQWKRIDKDFGKSIDDFIKNTLEVEEVDDFIKDIDVFDIKLDQNSEGLFNKKVSDFDKSRFILFDKAKLQISNGRKDKEFCDLLEYDHNTKKIKIINVKQFGQSSSINHLFIQSKTYCSAFISDKVFLSEVRKYISQSSYAYKDEIMGIIPSDIADNNGNLYELGLWLLYDKKYEMPSKSDIPFMSKYELKLTYELIRNGLKFKKITLSFVPIRRTHKIKADVGAK